ncbi:MAG TPA: helix-turn-helix domain-containing protein [Pedobacter sp.]|jgi:transcriptional regulator with XRE-family HTH domain
MDNLVQGLRENQNLTQMELAERSGLSLRTIQRVEAGTVAKGYTLTALAKALQVEPEKLMPNPEVNIDINRVKLINISCLSFLILPFGNIIIPAILNHNTKDIKVRELGRKVLGIQIIWTVITSVLLIAAPFMQLALTTKIPFIIIFLLLLFGINIIIIIRNAFSLNQNRKLAISLGNNIL